MFCTFYTVVCRFKHLSTGQGKLPMLCYCISSKASHLTHLLWSQGHPALFPVPSPNHQTLPMQQNPHRNQGMAFGFWLRNTHGLIFLTEKRSFFIMFNILVAVVETFVLWRASHSRPRVRFLSGTLNIVQGKFLSPQRLHLRCIHTTLFGFSVLRHPRTLKWTRGKLGSWRKSCMSGTQWSGKIKILLWLHYCFGVLSSRSSISNLRQTASASVSMSQIMLW